MRENADLSPCEVPIGLRHNARAACRPQTHSRLVLVHLVHVSARVPREAGPGVEVGERRQGGGGPQQVEGHRLARLPAAGPLQEGFRGRLLRVPGLDEHRLAISGGL